MLRITSSNLTTFREFPVTVLPPNLSKPAMQYFIALASAAGQPERFIPYRPAHWLAQKPTCRNRMRWSRWTRRLAARGFLRRAIEASRDRVRSVAVTAEGWNRLVDQCGEGAIVDLVELDWTSICKLGARIGVGHPANRPTDETRGPLVVNVPWRSGAVSP